MRRRRSYEDFLQTDAPINQGNSGGALVNLKGELVGINSQIASMTGGNIGIGFAIPANMARHVMDDLKDTARVRRAQLGVSVQDINSDLAASLDLKDVPGAIVSSVEPRQCGGKGGHEAGRRHRVVRRPCRCATSTRCATVSRRARRVRRIRSSIVRDGQRAHADDHARRGGADSAPRLTAEGPAQHDSEALGIRVVAADAGARAARRHPRPRRRVSSWRTSSPDSRAASAGLQPGDVIKEVNRQPVEDGRRPAGGCQEDDRIGRC